MHAVSKEILERYQVRMRKKQKTAFIDFLKPKLEAAGYAVAIEKSREFVLTRNIVVGNPETAQYIFAAHYDTQPILPFPVVMTPKSVLMYILTQLLLMIPFMVLLFVPVFLYSLAVWSLPPFPLQAVVVSLGTLVLMVFVFYFLLAGIPNKHTANDNTSGVITLAESMLALPPALRGRAAFVLFDNEELGMIGAAAFKARHRELMKHAMLVNFDCVSDGDYIGIGLSKTAKKDARLAADFKAAFQPTEDKTVTLEKGTFIYTSDQMMFKKTAAVCALQHSKWFGYYMGRIHTARDVVFDERNIELLRDGIVRLLERS